MERTFAKVLDIEQITSHYSLITIMAPQLVRSVQPGQFIHVRTGELLDPLLRRPFSIHDWHPGEGTMQLLFQVKGKGTQLLAGKQKGEQLDVLGPLGNGFAIPKKKGKALLIGGGIGEAPLWGLARTLKEAKWEVTTVLGAAKQSLLARNNGFSQWGETYIATEDGSVGIKGRVTNLLPLVAAEQFDQVYACGPKPLLAALYPWANSNNLPLQVSLDEVMACGMGVCLGCVQPVGSKEAPVLAKVCTDGPVFSAEEVVWDD